MLVLLLFVCFFGFVGVRGIPSGARELLLALCSEIIPSGLSGTIWDACSRPCFDS